MRENIYSNKTVDNVSFMFERPKPGSDSESKYRHALNTTLYIIDMDGARSEFMQTYREAINESLENLNRNIAYSAKMQMDGKKMRLHMRHVTYFIRPDRAFGLTVLGEVTHVGDNEYIIKPYVIWR